jgi:hypothetical protein
MAAVPDPPMLCFLLPVLRLEHIRLDDLTKRVI